jgi:selenocysteine-specific elongation factor
VLARLELLARGDPDEVVLAALRDERTVATGAKGPRRPGGYGGREPAQVAQVTGLPREDVDAALAELVARATAIQAGPGFFAADEWDRLRLDSTRLLEDYHRQFPLRAGLPREEWRSRLGLSPRQGGEVVAALLARGELAEASAGAGSPNGQRPSATGVAGTHGASLRRPDFAPRLTPAQQAAVDAMLARFRREPFGPPTRAEVEEALGQEVTAALLDQGTLVKVTDAILLERAAYEEAVARIVAFLRTHDTLTVADARDLLATTRKYMLAIFEHLDERRITRRQGDDRVLGPNAPAVPGSSAPTA